MLARRAKEDRSHSREVRGTGIGNGNRSKVQEVNSYNFYGEHSA
jgi:hypothetical protein